jgi:hypothetical protein
MRPFYRLCSNDMAGSSFKNIVVFYISAGRPAIGSCFDDENNMNIVRGFMFDLNKEMQKINLEK